LKDDDSGTTSSVKTPPATPESILNNIPAWQRDLVLQSTDLNKTVVDAAVSSDRKSTVLEDSRLLDKLNAIEKEKSVSVSGRNAVATTTTITTMTTVEQHVEVNKAIVSVDNHNHNNNNNNNWKNMIALREC